MIVLPSAGIIATPAARICYEDLQVVAVELPENWSWTRISARLDSSLERSPRVLGSWLQGHSLKASSRSPFVVSEK